MMGKWKRYYPIKLIDVVTGKVNSNYVLMYVTDFIDAFDIEKSSYRYNEKYNFYSFIPTETYLNEKECAGHDVFRCCRSVASIYVSERVKAIVEKMDWFCFLPTIEHGKGQLGMTKSGKQMSESWLFGTGDDIKKVEYMILLSKVE